MLKSIKLIHTIIWAVMVAAIFYVFYCGLTNTFNFWLWSAIGLIIFEGLVLLINKGTCPLTPLARKYSTDQKDNFDIYLPNIIAKYNKIIFTSIFVAGILLLMF